MNRTGVALSQQGVAGVALTRPEIS